MCKSLFPSTLGLHRGKERRAREYHRKSSSGSFHRNRPVGCLRNLCTDFSTLFPQSSQLRFLVHLIGDIHQPLHILNYFDASFPSGDQSTLSPLSSPRRQPLLRARARQRRVGSGQSPCLDGRLCRVFLRLQGIARGRRDGAPSP